VLETGVLISQVECNIMGREGEKTGPFRLLGM
jgi:hypothetical protein